MPFSGDIHVIGDSTVDWFLSEPANRRSPSIEARHLWGAGQGPGLTGNPGGAPADVLILKAAAEVRGLEIEVRGPQLPEVFLHDASVAEITRSYSVWNQLPSRIGSNDRVWRMERFIGLHRANDVSEALLTLPPEQKPSLLLIEDGNQAFRNDSSQWNAWLEASPEHILIRQTGASGQGDLWSSLVERHADNLTLFCFVGDLRREGAPIGQPLSWERTAQEIVTTIKQRRDLREAKRVVVGLATSGVVIVDRDAPPVLLFDPEHQEGDWGRERPGIWFGAGTAVLLSLAFEFGERSGEADIVFAAKRGLAAARSLHERGFDAAISASGPTITFPVLPVAESISCTTPEAVELQTATISVDSAWRLFDTAFEGSFREAAEHIARNGVEGAGNQIPIERMGAWSSVDRIEIESMRSVRNIVGEYLASKRRLRPLNLAVFGPPGSGKSFAIKQMAKAMSLGQSGFSTLEFNLSQFRTVDDLPAALQQVRDQALKGTLPLVFWDEFDSSVEGRELGWLVHFLAPMQDGSFDDGGISRPIGPAIFVFAGGTHSTMDSFKKRAVELPGAKATDFLSRLRGFVNVLGPNPGDDDDRTYPLRRALLLRAIIQAGAPQFFEGDMLRIDDAILRAFLDVPRYLHGSRSMESVVEMSAISGGLAFERSALPAVHQLALHVDAEAFMNLVEAKTQDI